MAGRGDTHSQSIVCRLSKSRLLLCQARKPYTITKQRERWTDAEHARFLEALRLHGRAWRRIEGDFCTLPRWPCQH